MGLLRVRFPGKYDKAKAVSGKAVCGAPELSPAKDEWEDKDGDIKMEDLFPKAAISERRPPTVCSDTAPSKRDLSMLKKLMRRRGGPSPLDEFSDKIRRNLLRESTVRAAPSTGCNMTPDLVSERGYDSDAQFISTPIESDRSPESARTVNLLESIRTNSQRAGETTCSAVNEQSPITTAGKFGILPLPAGAIQPCVEERMECATPSHKWSQTWACEDETRDIPSARLQRSSSLTVPKRRKATDCPPRNAGRRSFFATNTIQAHTKAKAQSGFVVQRNTTTQSKFTEIFELGNLGSPARLRDPNTGNSRKVSVAWMSDGRRVGYGYSFVHNGEDGGTTHAVSSMGENQPASRDMNCGREASSGQQQDLQTQKPRYGKMFERRDGSQGPQSREHGRGLDDPARKLSLWSRLPSRTRADINGPMAPSFYADASPERDADGDLEKRFDRTAEQDDTIRKGAKPSGRHRIEVLRYRAGQTVDAARSRVPKFPELEVFPFWPHGHKQDPGDQEKEAKRGRKRTRGFDGVVVGAKAPGRQEGNRWHESTKENFPVRG